MPQRCWPVAFSPFHRTARSNCSLLPITNTTAEMLAEYLAGRVREDLRAEGLGHLSAIELEVEESFGQSGYYRTTF